MSWSNLPGFKRDLLIATAIVARDTNRQACGIVIIDEMRERFDQHKSNEAYYMGLQSLRQRGLIEVCGRDGRRKIHEMTPTGAELLKQHRADLDESVRVVA